MSGGMRGVLSDLVYGAIKACGVENYGLRVLMYHRVTDAHPKERLCVAPQAFAAQMQWLADQGFRTATFAEAVDWVSGKGGLKPKRVVITFDDGFEDNFLHAAPALNRHGFTGCFFIPTGFLESGRLNHPGPDRPMSVEHLNTLLSQGHEIGAHSVTHRKLARLNERDIHREVGESKQALDSRLAKPASFFCYPAGSYNRKVREAVIAAGFQGACTVEPGANHPRSDPFLLKRTEVNRFDSLRDFEKKMVGAYDWLHAAIQFIHGFTERDKECASAIGPPR